MSTAQEFSEAFLVSAARRLGHGPPFGAAEFAGIKIFHLEDDPRPGGLECLPWLGQLGLVGCEAVDFEILRPLRRLWSLTCWGSNITSVALLPEVAPHLKLLEVVVGQVRDVDQ